MTTTENRQFIENVKSNFRNQVKYHMKDLIHGNNASRNIRILQKYLSESGFDELYSIYLKRFITKEKYSLQDIADIFRRERNLYLVNLQIESLKTE